MKSIHDNEIEDYKVNLKQKTIVLKTINAKKENVEIKFKDVLTHFFKNSSHQNIIFDITTGTIEKFVFENKQLIEESQNMCWPLYSINIKDLQNRLEKQEYKYFVIESSNGLCGFVLAKEMNIE